MLVEFTVGNYLSFKERKTFSLEAAAITEFPGNIIKIGGYKLLRSGVIYGANSSGKSNFIKAFLTMQKIITSSAKYNSSSELDVTPFLLSTETENRPSFFEVLFIVNGTRYRYGFETDKNVIHSEWLYERKTKNQKLQSEKNLFVREYENIELGKNFGEGIGLEEKTRNNALFLSVVDQFNGEISKQLMQWFNQAQTFSGIQHEKEKAFTFLFLGIPTLSGRVRDFIRQLDLGFKEFEVKDEKIYTFHNLFDGGGKIIAKREFDLVSQESSGTNKLYDIAASILYGLYTGKVTVIDELDAKLHPALTMNIVKLFNCPETNVNNSQLVFATHDTNLLSHGCFRRDQIYFTEKDKYEASDLYSLVEYIEPEKGSKIRKDASFENDYISGRYGAIPFIGDFSKIISDGESS